MRTHTHTVYTPAAHVYTAWQIWKIPSFFPYIGRSNILPFWCVPPHIPCMHSVHSGYALCTYSHGMQYTNPASCNGYYSSPVLCTALRTRTLHRCRHAILRHSGCTACWWLCMCNEYRRDIPISHYLVHATSVLHTTHSTTRC